VEKGLFTAVIYVGISFDKIKAKKLPLISTKYPQDKFSTNCG